MGGKERTQAGLEKILEPARLEIVNIGRPGSGPNALIKAKSVGQ